MGTHCFKGVDRSYTDDAGFRDNGSPSENKDGKSTEHPIRLKGAYGHIRMM